MQFAEDVCWITACVTFSTCCLDDGFTFDALMTERPYVRAVFAMIGVLMSLYYGTASISKAPSGVVSLLALPPLMRMFCATETSRIFPSTCFAAFILIVGIRDSIGYFESYARCYNYECTEYCLMFGDPSLLCLG